MNTEFKIPPPTLTYTRKESLKRTEDAPWLTMAAVAASISLVLGIYMLMEPEITNVEQPRQQNLAEIETERTDTVQTKTTPILAQSSDMIVAQNTAQPYIIERPTPLQDIIETEPQRAQIPNIQVVDKSLTTITPIIELSIQPLTTITIDMNIQPPKQGVLQSVFNKIPIILADIGNSITNPYKKNEL